MKLSMTGWNRNMGSNRIGNPDLRSATPNRPTIDVMRLKKRDSELQMSWFAEHLTLTGNYQVDLSLTEYDVLGLFKAYFGTHLSLADLESNGIHLTNEGLREKIRSMPAGELFDIMGSNNQPGHDEEDSPTAPPPARRRIRLIE
jgi:hypothetical protein